MGGLAVLLNTKGGALLFLLHKGQIYSRLTVSLVKKSMFVRWVLSGVVFLAIKMYRACLT